MTEDQAFFYRYARPIHCEGNRKPLSLPCFRADEVNVEEHAGNEYATITSKRSENGQPCGVSVFTYNSAHKGSIYVDDVPPAPELQQLYVIPSSSPDYLASMAFQRLISRERNLENAGRIKWRSDICYRCGIALSSIPQLGLVADNVETGHHTLFPSEHEHLLCDLILLPGHSSDSYFFSPIFDQEWTLHCIRLRAAAEPNAFQDHFDQQVWRMIKFLFDYLQEFEENVVEDVIALSQFANRYDYPKGLLSCIDRSTFRSWIDAFYSVLRTGTSLVPILSTKNANTLVLVF